MLDNAALCGWTLARAHARSGDADDYPETSTNTGLSATITVSGTKYFKDPDMN